MRVVFDSIIYELQRAGGISLYWSELISRADPLSSIFCGKPNDNIFSPNIAFVEESYPSFLPRRYLPFWMKGGVGKSHIFHSSYLRFSSDSAALNVSTVHDFTYERYIHGLKGFVHGLQKRLAVKQSAGVICVSENTKADLLNFYPWVDERCVRVIYNGVGRNFFPLNDAKALLMSELGYFSKRPFLLFVGDRSLYKNFDIFLQLGKIFLEFDLVVVGGQAFSTEEKNKLSSISSRVKHFRGLSSESLNILYGSAFCLIYPSSYEGFGIPVLEAMKAGCPVISTRCSSIPEVAGEAALLVDSVSVDAFVDQLNALMSPELYEALRQKGYVQASKFSWDKCFKETTDFYKEVWDALRT